MPVTPAASAARIIVPRFPGDSIDSTDKPESLSGYTGCGKSLNRDDSPPQGLKPSLILHDLRGAKAPLYHSAAGFRDFFRSLYRRALPDWARGTGYAAISIRLSRFGKNFV